MVANTAAWHCMLILLTVSLYADGIELFPNSSPLWMRTESTLNLTCSTDGLTELSWYKNNVKMNIDYTAGFMMTARQYPHSQVTISNLWKVDVGIGDSGTYSCHDSGQRHLKESIDVRIINVVGSDVIKKAGHSATLRCNPQNLKHEDFKRIEWRRNYNRLPYPDPSNVKENRFSLHLDHLDEKDAGDYECIFTFETKGPDGIPKEMNLSKKIRLDVLGRSESKVHWLMF